MYEAKVQGKNNRGKTYRFLISIAIPLFFWTFYGFLRFTLRYEIPTYAIYIIVYGSVAVGGAILAQNGKTLLKQATIVLVYIPVMFGLLFLYAITIGCAVWRECL